MNYFSQIFYFSMLTIVKHYDSYEINWDWIILDWFKLPNQIDLRINSTKLIVA